MKQKERDQNYEYKQKMQKLLEEQKRYNYNKKLSIKQSKY